MTSTSPSDTAQRLLDAKAQLDRIEEAFDRAEDLIEQLWDAEIARAQPTRLASLEGTKNTPVSR